MDEKLIFFKLSNDTYNCDDIHCKPIQQCQDIDYLCRSIINYCVVFWLAVFTLINY